VSATTTFIKPALTAAAGIGVALVASAANTSAATTHACSPSGSKTLAQTASVRVYRLGEVRVYGCVFSSGVRRRLDRGSEFPVQSSTVRINGRFVGFARGAPTARGNDLSVNVVDLKSGDARYAVRDPGGTDDIAPISDLEVTSTGAMGWIVRVESEPHVRRNEVLTVDTAGVRIRDAGTDTAGIEPNSLAVSGRRLYWVKGGTATAVKLR
jgi:hypothetical protein